ncbi:SRPBCC family protein [Arthrobacter sp. A5]|uniref:SRPBCC family protein n=1 Tax=Arthrobacter sp. A5 TaxID=576926 RepID=UPI003DA7AE97
MKRTFSVSDSIIIGAGPAALYDRISDVARMGEWSPENRGATVHDDRANAYVGMVFDGRNKRGRFGWTTQCTVTAAERGRKFRFRVHAIGLETPRLRGPIATWEYRFEPAEAGTRVTETWTDDRRAWPDVAALIFDAVVTRGRTFAGFQRGNIRRTLQNLKTAAEG